MVPLRWGGDLGGIAAGGANPQLPLLHPDGVAGRTYNNLSGDERYPGEVTESRKFLVCTRKNNVWKIGWGQNTRYPEFTTKK
jgi:hypothetical protein